MQWFELVCTYTAQSSTDVSAAYARFSISVYLSTRHAKLKSVVIGVSKDSHSATSMRATYKWRQIFMESSVCVFSWIIQAVLAVFEQVPFVLV